MKLYGAELETDDPDLLCELRNPMNNRPGALLRIPPATLAAVRQAMEDLQKKNVPVAKVTVLDGKATAYSSEAFGNQASASFAVGGGA